MNVRSTLYIVYYFIIILIKNSNIICFKVGVLSNCDKSIDISLLKTFIRSFDNNVSKSIEIKSLNQLNAENNICEKGTDFPLIFNSLLNPEFNGIIASIDSELCELTRILTVIYKKYVITWNCRSLLTTENDNSNYFIRMTKSYRNGIILLSELLFQMKWRSVFVFVMRNNNIIEDNSSADNFIEGLKRFFYESHIEMRGSFVLDEHNIASSFKNFSKLISPNIKCKYRLISMNSYKISMAERCLSYVSNWKGNCASTLFGSGWANVQTCLILVYNGNMVFCQIFFVTLNSHHIFNSRNTSNMTQIIQFPKQLLLVLCRNNFLWFLWFS